MDPRGGGGASQGGKRECSLWGSIDEREVLEPWKNKWSPTTKNPEKSVIMSGGHLLFVHV